MMQDQCAGLEAFFESLGFLSIFFDISCGFVILFNDPFALLFVVLAAFVGIVFGALPGLTAAAAIAMMLPILIAYNDEIGGLAGLAFLYVIGKFEEHLIGVRAAGLTTATLLALVPLVTVVLAAARGLGVVENLDTKLDEWRDDRPGVALGKSPGMLVEGGEQPHA